MKSFNVSFEINTQEREEVIDITARVSEAVRDSGIEEGLLLVFPHHTSSAVYISDSDPALTLDFIDLAGRLAPRNAVYRHDETDFKKNAAAHLKAILTGHHVTLPVSGGRLDLGVYQRVYYAEFDGGRAKNVLVKLIGE